MSVPCPPSPETVAPHPEAPLAVCSAILAQAADSSPELILICRKSDGGIVYSNATAGIWLNQSAQSDLTARKLAEFIGIGSSKQFENEIVLMAHVLGRWSGECVLRDTWGSEFPVKATLTIHRPAPLSDESFICLQAILAPDSTATQQAMLTSDHELLHALMETVPDNIYFKDRQSRFIRVSRAFALHQGRKEAHEFIGLTDFDLFSSEHALQAYEDEQRIMRTSEPIINQEEKETWPDGHVTWVSTTKLPLHDTTGKVVGTFGISRNITAEKLAAEENRQLELKLNLSQKLESIGRLAAGIAHEINTPTQYITDNIHFLRDSLTPLTAYIRASQHLQQAASQHASLATACAAVQAALPASEVDYLLAEIPQTLTQSHDGLGRIARIVRSLKEFSHPQNSHRAPVDLNHVIETAITVSRHEWKYVAEVVTDFTTPLPPVPCIVDEFNQVILNLIINAAHAIESMQKKTGPGAATGKITLRTRHDSTHVIVEIADTGIGIPPENHARIFEPFFTTKEIGKGTGQGLAIVRSVIVQHHQGTVDFTSAVDQGTTFQLRLPLSLPAPHPS